jgi:hypothetical protein
MCIAMSNSSRDDLFLQLVAMFQFAAMQQMGKLPSPMTGKIERDLAQARISIDMLEMLSARTESHRSPRESEYLDKVLFELRMNYVEEAKRPAEPGPEKAESAPDELHEEEGTDGQ